MISKSLLDLNTSKYYGRNRVWHSWHFHFDGWVESFHVGWKIVCNFKKKSLKRDFPPGFFDRFTAFSTKRETFSSRVEMFVPFKDITRSHAENEDSIDKHHEQLVDICEDEI